MPDGGDRRAAIAAGGKPGNSNGAGVGFDTVDDTNVTSSSSEAVKSIGLVEDRPYITSKQNEY
jgi:hypothetical protein